MLNAIMWVWGILLVLGFFLALTQVIEAWLSDDTEPDEGGPWG